MTDTLLVGVVGVPFYAGLGVGAFQLARAVRQTDLDDREILEGIRWLWMVWVLDLGGCGRELLLFHVIAAWRSIFMNCQKN